ncbi:right-handed parallel beta-helix repeat-containing protein [Draconibacterium sediminis]|uniref:right-handed parallel beta-helix repeat-containing protein n=1 Tax=Draconibacterium sediminis TaxID=1544798 RepID=UPI0005D3B512|nr:right-handed parallel beta-helix repeat-containing protein [Draconibacterium sediminis]
MRPGFLIILFSWLFSFTVQASASEIPNDTTYIFLKDYGLYKTRKNNAIKHFYKALEDLKTDQPKVLVFSTGTYHFYPDDCKTKVYYQANTLNAGPKVCAFHFENIKNLVIDGRGSHLIFHQEMQPFTFDNCENITLKNVTIDWEQPFIAQAEVLRATDLYIDIALNPRETPYHLEEGKIYFDVGNGRTNEWEKTLEFDRNGRFIVPHTGDNPCLGEDWEAYTAEATMPGIVRLHFNFKRKPQIGNFLVMQHATPTHAGIFISESENIAIENTRLYHAAGSGILSQYSKNLEFDRYQAVPNRSKIRYFGGGFDGLRIVNCQGKVWVNNCTFEGLVNEPVYVYGISVRVDEVISGNEVKCSHLDKQSEIQNWARPGDQVNFVGADITSTVKTITPIDDMQFSLLLDQPIPTNLQAGACIENLSWTQDLTIRNSNFKSSRASGIVLATPGKVLIENNTFESSGSAILIAGDANTSLKTGGVSDVSISGNIFTSLCNSSTYRYNEAVISINPVIPALNDNNPGYHRNISIQHNQFDPFDYPLLYALSAEALSFKGNTITRNYDFSPFHNRLYTFSLEYCKLIEIIGNNISDDVLGRNIYLKRTPENELKTDMESIFTFEKY